MFTGSFLHALSKKQNIASWFLSGHVHPSALLVSKGALLRLAAVHISHKLLNLRIVVRAVWWPRSRRRDTVILLFLVLCAEDLAHCWDVLGHCHPREKSQLSVCLGPCEFVT